MKQYSIGYNIKNKIINLPNEWKVNTIKIVKPEISKKEIKNVIINPINSRRICDLSKKGDTVSIIIEDFARPTPLEEILEVVLDELRISGIRDEDIMIIGSTGAHRMMNKNDFKAKIGNDIFNKIICISHNPFEGNKFIGTTSRGTPLSINEKVFNSKIKIGIGGIIPHGLVGFGGGGKMILPGISAYSTIEYNHTKIERHKTGDPYEVEVPARHDIEEAAGMAGLNFIIGGLIDDELKLVDIVAGHPITAHRLGATKAKKLYSKFINKKSDIIIACTYPLERDFFQAGKGLKPIPIEALIKKDTVVIWTSSSIEGLGCHHLVQESENHKQRFISGFQRMCKKATVIFYSHNLRYKEIKEFLPNEMIFVQKFEEAIDKARSLKPYFPEVSIIYSVPFSVFK